MNQFLWNWSVQRRLPAVCDMTAATHYIVHGRCDWWRMAHTC